MLALLLSLLFPIGVTLTDSGRVMVEVPDSLIGTKVCLAARILEISDPGEAVSGQISENCVPLVFRKDDGFVDIFQLAPGLDGKASEGLFKRVKPDSTGESSSVLDLTELFTGEFASLKIYPSTAYNSNNGSVMRTHIPQSGKSAVESVFDDGDCAGAVCDISYKMEGHLYGMFKVEGDFSLRARVAKFFFLPEATGQAAPLDKSWKYGARTFSLKVLEGGMGQISEKTFVQRRNLSRKIDYSMDPLMPEPWKLGIRRAVNIWNKGLEPVGAGALLSCREGHGGRYLQDSFLYAPSGMEAYEATIIADPVDGTIYASSIVLHSSYISKLCFQYMADMASSDTRARADRLPDDVVADIVCAVALQGIGRSLGLNENPAASFSCPADSLRSVSFTGAYGVALSAMEAPVFNYIASRADVERGVATVQNTLTPYDIAAFSTHYGISSEPCTSIRYSSNRDESGAYVPYALRGDLSCEPIAALDALKHNQKELVANLDTWFSDKEVRNKVAAVSKGTYARFLVRLTDYLKGDFPEGPDRKDIIGKVTAELRSLEWLGDDKAADMYRTNVFRTMVSSIVFPEDLEYAYSVIGNQETAWLDIFASRLETLAGLDAIRAGAAVYANPETDDLAACALVLLQKMKKDTSDKYLRTRLENIL